MSQAIVGAAFVDVVPPTPGVTPAPQVHADLGSAAIPVTVQTQGAANIATAQLTTSSSAQQMFAARATRRSLVITNIDSTNTVYFGAAAVTSSTGSAILPQTSMTIPTTAAVYVVAGAGTPVVTGAEAYD